jgi:hypothetical protein
MAPGMLMEWVAAAVPVRADVESRRTSVGLAAASVVAFRMLNATMMAAAAPTA